MATKVEFESAYKAATDMHSKQAILDYVSLVKHDSTLGRVKASMKLHTDKLNRMPEEIADMNRQQKNMYRHVLREMHLLVCSVKSDNKPQKTWYGRLTSKKIELIALVVAILALVVTLAAPYISRAMQKPDILITNLLVWNIDIVGHNSSTPLLQFRAESVGDRDVRTAITFWINTTAITRNTCGNVTFFPSHREICSYSYVSELPFSIACGHELPSITSSAGVIEFNVTQDITTHEIDKFLNATSKTNISQCDINESIRVCASYECSESYCPKNCSASVPVSIAYRQQS